MCQLNKCKSIKLLQKYLKYIEDMIYIAKKVTILSEVCSQNFNTDIVKEIDYLNQRIKVLKQEVKRIDQELNKKTEDTDY